MNAVSDSANNFIEENAGGNDSDTDSDELPEYYQPISAEDGYEAEDGSDEASSERNSAEEDSSFRSLANGYADRMENGVASLDLSDNEDGEINEAEEEEDVTVGETSNSTVIGAFREDESRRNAPLTPETSTRVMEAMRGVTFSGIAPDWADRVPEDQWINQLRSLRVPPTTIRD